MKKNNGMFYLSLGIVFVLFNVITFVIPTDKTPTFWTAYIFTIVAFILQLIVWKITLGKNEIKSRLFDIPILHIGIVYLIVQLIAFAIFMIFPILPVRLAIIVCCIILAAFALFTIATKTGINEINRVEEKIKIKRYFIQSLQIDIEMLAESESNTEIKAELKKLAEKVRFSDPMSHEMLGELESRISDKVEEMKIATDKKALIKEVDVLITERNKKCKILK